MKQIKKSKNGIVIRVSKKAFITILFCIVLVIVGVIAIINMDKTIKPSNLSSNSAAVSGTSIELTESPEIEPSSTPTQNPIDKETLKNLKVFKLHKTNNSKWHKLNEYKEIEVRIGEKTVGHLNVNKLSIRNNENAKFTYYYDKDGNNIIIFNSNNVNMILTNDILTTYAEYNKSVIDNYIEISQIKPYTYYDNEHRYLQYYDFTQDNRYMKLTGVYEDDKSSGIVVTLDKKIKKNVLHGNLFTTDIELPYNALTLILTNIMECIEVE